MQIDIFQTDSPVHFSFEVLTNSAPPSGVVGVDAIAIVVIRNNVNGDETKKGNGDYLPILVAIFVAVVHVEIEPEGFKNVSKFI